MFYATLSEVKSEMIAQTDILNKQTMRYIRMVSERINKIMTGKSTRHIFWPTIATYQVPIDSNHVNSRNNTLLLDSSNSLLAITSVTADGTSVTANAAGYPAGDSPIRQLRISSSGDWWYSYITTCDDPAYASIAGVWGYHSDYANAWLQVDALAAAITSTTATTFTVANVDGDDPYGFIDRLSAGNLVKIDSEYMIVVATNDQTNTVTAIRGAQGSTAATHLVAAPVYVWQTEEPIVRAVTRQVGLLQARRGAYQVETVDGVGTISYPQDLLRELSKTLQEYING